MPYSNVGPSTCSPLQKTPTTSTLFSTSEYTCQHCSVDITLPLGTRPSHVRSFPKYLIADSILLGLCQDPWILKHPLLIFSTKADVQLAIQKWVRYHSLNFPPPKLTSQSPQMFILNFPSYILKWYRFISERTVNRQNLSNKFLLSNLYNFQSHVLSWVIN